MTIGDVYRDSIHRTLTFSLAGAMDDDEASDALVRLGVGMPPCTPSGNHTRRWLGCCLRSDGVVELWKMPGADPGGDSLAPSPSEGSPVSRLAAAGLPYELA